MDISEILKNANGLEIAIIGMAGRFPGARNVEKFWQNLQQGVECISSFTIAELEAAGINPELLRNPNYVRSRGALNDIDLFDAAFFGILPEEATAMDPQHRIFLECAWEALENAGHDPESVEGLVGLYAGSGLNSYSSKVFASRDLLRSVSSVLATIMSEKDHLTTRISYELNLKGPSLTIQTFCSTSLVAIHLACQGLLSGSCDMALGGGVSVSAQQRRGYLYQEGGIASPDGHCRAFDASAKGTVGGSGAAIVVLKRLEDALTGGDHIHAVIKGSAINNDGSQRVGYTAPSVDGQARVIRDALRIGEVNPETVTFVEAHGTGTELGDPIEVAGLTQAFRASTQKKGFCAIGSVKTNVGHLDTAAGVTGVIKTVLMLKEKKLVPSLHFKEPNPRIDFANSPFYVNASLARWETDSTPRRAGVSSFGIGGTNAHVVLEEAPDIAGFESCRPFHLLVLSAKTETALENRAGNLVEYLRENKDSNIADIAYTLQVGRRAFSHRRYAVCSTVNDAIEAFESQDMKQVYRSSNQTENLSIAFMFPGQGAQHVNMGREIYNLDPVFRQQVDLCSEILGPQLGLDLRQILFPADGQFDAAKEKIDQTFLTQPSLFVIEYALSKLYQSWGLTPQAMIGHSIGEYVAACLAGVFSLEDALAIVAARARLMQQLPRGAMLAVFISEDELQPYLDQEISLAAINGPSQCVVSGPVNAVDELQQRLEREAKTCRRLSTSHAFHSRMMSQLVEPMMELFKGVKLNSPKIAYLSNVTGTWITNEQAINPQYWATHLCRTVRISDGFNELLKDAGRVLIEVGPGSVLSALARRHPARQNSHLITDSMSASTGRKSEVESLMMAAGRLWLAGVKVNWANFYAGESRRRVPLPSYPFEREPYWVKPDSRSNLQLNSQDAQDNRTAVGVDERMSPPVLSALATRTSQPIASTVRDINPENTDDSLEEILSLQLRIISQQLELLSDNGNARQPMSGRVEARLPDKRDS
ncbi:MAG: type I polyketide synthase [Blastocatellia bacterium]